MPQRRASAPQHRRVSLIPCTSAQPQAAHIPHQPRALAIAAQCALLASLSAGAMGLLLAPEFAHAQAAQSAQASQPAQVKSYNIPASSLAEALRAFASAAGVELTVNGTLVQGRQSRGLNGNYSVAGGFDVLLSGHNLEAVRQGNGSYALRVVETLPEVTVTAPGRGSGRGDVATLPEVVVTAGALGVTEGTGSFTTDSSSSATGMNLSLRETPQSVSIVTRERMDQQQLNSLADVAEQTVGIAVNSQGPAIGGYTTLYSRGFAIDNYQVDGMHTSSRTFSSYFSNGQASLDTAIYDSITIVRGATGLLANNGDPSGTINLSRKRPTRQFQGSIEAGLGRWDQRRAVADVGGPVNAEGSVRARLVAAYDESKHWVKDYEGDRHLLYAVVDADLGNDTVLSLALEHGKQKSNVGLALGYPLTYSDGTFTPFGRHDTKSPTWRLTETTRTNFSTLLEHSFNSNWSAKINYNYTKRKYNERSTGTWGLTLNNTITSDIDKENYNTDIHTLSGALNGRYTLLGRAHDLVIGLNGSKEDTRIDNWSTTLSAIPIIDGRIQYPENPDWDSFGLKYTDRKINEYGFYVGTRLSLTDRFSAIAGARWSTYDQKSVGSYLNQTQKYSGEITPYFGLVYDISENISTYASYTDIFKAQYYSDVNGNFLEPETGENYEIGLKGEWFGGNLNASIAAFETKKDNLAVWDNGNLTPSGSSAYRAEDNTTSRGWEFELAGRISPLWNIQGGYNRVVSKDSDGELLETQAQPKHQFKVFTSYDIASIPGLTLGGGAIWRSKTYYTAYTGIRQLNATQKSYTVANLMARYSLNDKLTFTVNLNNVFNKNYRTNPGTHDYGAERNLYATVKYQF